MNHYLIIIVKDYDINIPNIPYGWLSFLIGLPVWYYTSPQFFTFNQQIKQLEFDIKTISINMSMLYVDFGDETQTEFNITGIRLAYKIINKLSH